MASGIYVSSSAAKARLEQLETISNNLANMMTAGFKRQEAIYREIHNEVNSIASTDQAQGVRTPVRFLPEDRIGTSIDDHYTSWAQGPLDETNNTFDLAVEGQGFFSVKGPQEQIMYTRNGRFTLDSEGVLRDQGGHEVLDINQQRIRIPVNQGQIDISYDGQVSANSLPFAKIGLYELEVNQQPVDPNNPNANQNLANPDEARLNQPNINAVLNTQLDPIGKSLYKLQDPNIATKPASGIIRQGYVEGSNVNAVFEMTNLLSSTRLFEYSSTAMKAYNEMDLQAARDVSRVNS
jgi:flagellar basal body rod protein FlgG